MLTAKEVLDLLLLLQEKGWDLSKTPFVFEGEIDKDLTIVDYDSTEGDVYIC